MEGQNTLEKVETIEREKTEKQQLKEQKAKQKLTEKELFYNCKDKCRCTGKCPAKDLRQCTVCHEVKRSVCSKGSCSIDGKKPQMLAVAAQKKRTLKFSESDNSDECDEESTIESDCESDSLEEISSDEEIQNAATEKLQRTWSSLNPPVQEREVVGKWYAGIYEGKKGKKLCIGRLARRFLEDKDGEVDGIEMRCLKPKVGLGTVMEDTPDHLPDIGIFKMYDITDGPLDIVPLKGNKWDVPDYDVIYEHFKEVSALDRRDLLQ